MKPFKLGDKSWRKVQVIARLDEQSYTFETDVNEWSENILKKCFPMILCKWLFSHVSRLCSFIKKKWLESLLLLTYYISSLLKGEFRLKRLFYTCLCSFLLYIIKKTSKRVKLLAWQQKICLVNYDNLQGHTHFLMKYTISIFRPTIWQKKNYQLQHLIWMSPFQMDWLLHHLFFLLKINKYVLDLSYADQGDLPSL